MDKFVTKVAALFPRMERMDFMAAAKSGQLALIDKLLPKSGKILDIGSGSGMMDFYMKLKAPQRQIKGIDSNIKRIGRANNIAEENKIRIKFEFLDLNHEYKLEKSKAYLINDVLHHLTDETKTRLLQKIFSEMGKSEVVVIGDILKEQRLRVFIIGIFHRMHGEGAYFLTEDEMVDMIRRAGFKVEKIGNLYKCTKLA